MNYSDKTILITGASSGIGAATAIELARFNNRLIITARRESLLEKIAGEIRAAGSEALAICGDATLESHGKEVVQQIIKTYGDIDIAILNVGIGPPSNTLTASPDKIKFCLEANYYSFVHFFCPLIDRMKQQSRPCMIAHMNSQATWFGIPMQGDYTAAKAAARIFLDTARMELRHFGYRHIRLQTIHPGFVDTEAVRDDGIPAPNEISEQEAAGYVLKGLKKEMRENIFPPATKWATKLGKIIPHRILTKILLSQTPKAY
ncbi:MAG: SDR family NAD(P)-dependent oxidoreductase [Desulfobacterales bacterium]|nr:SDR family NAD(P)-dependent oxidoreductase [Desulfobacterales bacterium]